MISTDFILGYGAGKAAGAAGGGGSSLPDGFNGVAFIDYDGTVLHTYTPQEFSALSVLPKNPKHEGLTAQGWNWTKEQIAAQLTAVPGGPVIVGQMYITDDGKTRVYIHMEDGRLSPYLGLGINGSVDIDWGDGSTHDIATGSSASTVVNTQHTYAAPGDYVIVLTVTGEARIIGQGSESTLLWKASTTVPNENKVYRTAVERVEIGENVSVDTSAFAYCYSFKSITIPSGATGIGASAFSNCGSLTSVTIPSVVTGIYSNVFLNCNSLTSVAIPSGVTTIGAYMFDGCYSLKSVTIPSGVTSISASAFGNCYSLKSVTIQSRVTSINSSLFSGCHSLTSVTIPSGVTTIGSSAFSNCYALTSIAIPSGVTTIGSSAFSGCAGLGFIRFKGSTPPTVDNANAWNSVPTDCIIYVPASDDHSILNDYKAAQNYPDPNTYTYVEE